MAPAERADVIVDFSSLSPGNDVILRNLGPDGTFEFPTMFTIRPTPTPRDK